MRDFSIGSLEVVRLLRATIALTLRNIMSIKFGLCRVAEVQFQTDGSVTVRVLVRARVDLTLAQSLRPHNI